MSGTTFSERGRELTEEHNRKVRDVVAPEGSTSAECLALPQQRVWTSNMRGGIYRLPRTGLIVAPFRMEKGGAGCIVVVGDRTYPRGGHDLWVSELELQTAVEIDITGLEVAVEIAGKGWDMLHFSCDNTDHAEAYTIMAPAFVGSEKSSAESSH